MLKPLKTNATIGVSQTTKTTQKHTTLTTRINTKPIDKRDTDKQIRIRGAPSSRAHIYTHKL